jgi:hypothetical protein
MLSRLLDRPTRMLDLMGAIPALIAIVESVDKIAKVLLIRFWDDAQSHPTRKKIFVGRCSEQRPNYFCKSSKLSASSAKNPRSIKILSIAICAAICGADTWVDIEFRKDSIPKAPHLRLMRTR